MSCKPPVIGRARAAVQLLGLLLGTALLEMPAAAIELPEPPPDHLARVCFVRTYDFASASRWTVLAQDTPVGLLRNRSWFCADAQPGRYELSVRMHTQQTSSQDVHSAWNRSSSRLETTRAVELADWLFIDLHPGTTSWLRATYEQGILLWEAIDVAFVRERKLRHARGRHLYLHYWPGGQLVVEPTAE